MKTVEFTRIAIQNFLSVGEEPVIINFREGLHILTGNNKDKPERKNAVGKSTVADAIYFSIFGDSLREIKKDLIINNITGGKAHVELDFTVRTPSNVNEYKVVRTLSPTKVFVYEDGVDKTRDSAINTTKYICDVLSASPSIFQNCVIMTVNNAIPFMAKNKVEKRKFIEDIFGMEVFSRMISSIRSEYNDIKRQYDIETSKLEEAEKNYNNYIQQKDKSLDRKKEKKALYQERFNSNQEELKTLDNKLVNIMPVNVDDINAKKDELTDKLAKCESKIHEFVELISTKKSAITHKKEIYTRIGTETDTCPVCLRGIEDHDKEYIDGEKLKIKNEIETLVEDTKEFSTKMNNAKELKQRIQIAINGKQNEISQALLTTQKIKNINERIEQLNKWQKELEVDIAALENFGNEFDDFIKSSEERLVEIKNLIINITKTLSKLDIVKYIVSEEGVKSYIVNKLLDLLNSKLSFYLKKLDSHFVCKFNEYFEEEILNESGKICSYFNFSGAERKSIDLACLFAFSDIRRLQGKVSYNIAIYDELFDSSFDEKGIEHITEILKERVDQLNECSIVISHRKESVKAVTGEIIYLQKENGITTRVDYVE